MISINVSRDVVAEIKKFFCLLRVHKLKLKEHVPTQIDQEKLSLQVSNILIKHLYLI